MVEDDSRTILYSSHNTQNVEQISDSITFIDRGQVIASSNRDVLLTIASLLLGQRYFASKSPFLGFVADSSYWVYLLHLPIVIFLQTLLVPLALPWWLKFMAVLFGTLIPCMATYVVFVRYTPVGWLLHGKRSVP